MQISTVLPGQSVWDIPQEEDISTVLLSMVFPKATDGIDSNPKGFRKDLHVVPLEIDTQLLQSIPCQSVKPVSAPLSTDTKCSLGECLTGVQPR